jgi:UDP-N-acetylmuramoyl-L-alanyl-D-glutamate--2,6-diaminopimelate ligase
MKLLEVVAGLECTVHGDGEKEITAIDYDSRNVKPGSMFVALQGRKVDGKKFVAAALAAGAAAIVTDTLQQDITATQVVVADPLLAMADMSSRLYGHPDKKMRVIGVTGTNGKTTITYFLETLFSIHKLSTGVVGTVNYRYAGKSFPAPNTTPQSADLYRMFNDMMQSGGKVVAMEVSSHALALGRVRGIEFDTAIFTNLTRDHLDFHKTMEEYFAAKALLFSGLEAGEKNYAKSAIINIDDSWGKKLAGMVQQAEVLTYGIQEKAAVRAENIHYSSSGTDFTLVSPYGSKQLHIKHLGKHNVYNALASAAAALSAGIPFDGVVQGLESAPQAPGRLERVDAGQPFTVVVDYAHTDDALLNVLNALQELKTARIITVFGCGGDRDRSKRPVMGDIATANSDFVLVTSDNPRSEDPQKITLDIEVGIRRQHRTNYNVIIDREEAIAAAIGMAQKGDIILIAGKGHEDYQIIGDKRLHFNDVEVAKKCILKKSHQ